jgi:NMD protein affecting ribosome stability and mRNA decay
MGKCEKCGKEIEIFVTLKGQKLCVECADQAQGNIDLDSLNYGACI